MDPFSYTGGEVGGVGLSMDNLFPNIMNYRTVSQKMQRRFFRVASWTGGVRDDASMG